MNLEELLAPLKEKGIFVQMHQDIKRNRFILTLEMPGIPSQNIGFNLEAFMKDLATTLDDYAMLPGGCQTEVNISLVHIRQLNDPQDFLKWQKEQRLKEEVQE